MPVQPLSFSLLSTICVKRKKAAREKNLRAQLKRFAMAITETRFYDEDNGNEADDMCRWCQHVPSVDGGHAPDCLWVEAKGVAYP